MENYRIKHLWICGVRAIHNNVDTLVQNADLVLVRGEQACRWLELIDIDTQKVKKVQVNYDHNRSSHKLEILQPDIQNTNTLLYVTQVSPPSADLIAMELMSHSELVEMIGGEDPIWLLGQKGQITGIDRLQIVDGLSIVNDRYPQFSSTAPVLLHLDGSDVDMISFKESLLQAYPASHTLYSLSLAYPERGLWSELQITNLSSEREYETLHIPPLAADSTLENFMHVIAKLRAPDGCPWDRKQTHESLRRYLLEETYEALERLDNNDLPGLQEELGDLLLQIALHAEIAWESGSFDMTSVLQGINRKIVSRHPHVFSSVVVKDEGDVLRNWDKIKEMERSEKGDETQSGLLDGVPAILPALSQAQSLQERAARVGFDWPDIKPVIDKVFEEFEEIKQAPDAPSRAGELGDLLFAVVNLVRWYGVDAENALRQTNTKFRRRFAYIEKEATTAGRNLRDMTLEEMDLLWEAAKTPEKNQKSS